MSNVAKLLVIGLLTALVVVASPALAQTTTAPDNRTGRLPVPDAAAQKAAAKLAQDVFKDDLENAKTPEQKAALTDKILRQAGESKDDPAGRFVLLQMAIDQAAGVGDVNRALKAGAEMGGSFDISKARLKNMIVPKLTTALNLPGGGEAELSNLVAKEIDRPTAPLAQMRIGDGWWELGQKADGLPKASMLALAARWYQAAAPGLTGLTKAKVDKRLATIAQEAPAEGEQGASPQAATKPHAAPSPRGGWIVLLRSSDPSHWNTQWTDGHGNFSVKISSAPDDTAWLALGIPSTQQVMMIPMKKSGLLENQKIEGTTLGWNGTAEFGWGGYHLGIWNQNLPARNKATDINPGRNRGWGFGHRSGFDTNQGFSWAGEELDGPTVFEICVKAGPLTPEEEKTLENPVKYQLWDWHNGRRERFVVKINADGTGSKLNSDETFSWTANGNDLTLKWQAGLVEHMTLTADHKVAHGTDSNAKSVDGQLKEGPG